MFAHGAVATKRRRNEARHRAARPTYPRAGREILGTLNYAAVPAVIVAVLLGTTLYLNTDFLSPANIAVTLAVSSPLGHLRVRPGVCPVSGNHGLDLSVGPVLGFTTVLIAGVLVPNGFVAAPLLMPLVFLFELAVGALIGDPRRLCSPPRDHRDLGHLSSVRGPVRGVMPTPGGHVPECSFAHPQHRSDTGVLFVYAALFTAGWCSCARPMCAT